MPNCCLVQYVYLRKGLAVARMHVGLLQRVFDSSILTFLCLPVSVHTLPLLALKTSPAGVDKHHGLHIAVTACIHAITSNYLTLHVHPIISVLQVLQDMCFRESLMVVLHVHDGE